MRCDDGMRCESRSPRLRVKTPARTAAFGARAFVVATLLLKHVSSLPTGMTVCQDSPTGHGVVNFGPAAGAPWKFTLLQAGVPVSAYVGSGVYTLEITPVGNIALGGFIVSGFKGFTVGATDFTAGTKAGLLQPTD